MGYELYRLLALATPNMATSKSLSSCKRKRSGLAGKEPEVIDLDEEEKQMDLLAGTIIVKCLLLCLLDDETLFLYHLRGA